MREHGCGLASAFRTLTIIPFPGRESRHSATTLYWFPLVGLFLGAVSWGVCRLIGSPAALLAGPLAVSALAYLTRAFHLDGLGDMADGFGGGWDKDQKLRIMKDSHAGSFAVAAISSVLLCKAAAIALIGMSGDLLVLVAIPVLSRFFVVFQTVANPYARAGGGTASELVSGSRTRHLAVAALQVASAWIMCRDLPGFERMWMVFGAGFATTLAVLAISRRNIGGVTGDVLGATCELAETAMLCMAAWTVSSIGGL